MQKKQIIMLSFISILPYIKYTIQLLFQIENFLVMQKNLLIIEPYVIDNAERKKIESFEGDIENIEKLKFISAKYIKLAYELLLESN